jgi:hypothetical protein
VAWRFNFTPELQLRDGPMIRNEDATGEQANDGTIPAGHQPVTVVLDLVNPLLARWRSFGG